jgi:hypothetical protein
VSRPRLRLLRCFLSSFTNRDPSRPFSASSVSRRYAFEEHTGDAKVVELYDGILRGSRGHLAQAITLVESTHPVKKVQAQSLLTLVLRKFRENEDADGVPKSFRVGKSELPDDIFVKLILNFTWRWLIFRVHPFSDVVQFVSLFSSCGVHF